MIDHANYIRATNLAYKVLAEYNGNLPQIDIFEIINSYKNIKLLTYSDAAIRQRYTFEEFIENVTSVHGFTISNKYLDKHLIFYNEFKCNTTIRFTLAHELGHIILQHSEDNDTADREANCFARNLLCPIPIARELSLNTVNDYASCFEVSEYMAQVTMRYKRIDFKNTFRYYYRIIEDKLYEYLSGYTLDEMYA